RITKTREKELQLVIKHSYDGIVFLDLSYHIIRISETALDLLNLPGREEGYTGESFISMINEYIREELENQLDSTVQEGSIQLNNYRWDRRILEIITIPVLPETNQTSGIIVSFRDITEKTETEERLFRSRKLESVGRLASGVAHDFNNIIQAVSGYTSLLKDCDDQDEKRTYLLNIDSTVNRARSLVKQLLDFYRGETNNREILSIKNVIHDTMSMLGQLVGRGIDIRIEEGRDDIRILAAKSRIEQILINLVVNARDAMDRQGRITVKTGEIIKEGRLYAVLEVRDTGSGIPHEDLEKIFDPFFSTKGPGEGTGLGLSTVFSIVEDYQGIIEVDSIIHSGTTFRILLPEAEA
ncbi:MAG: ATP-binding protein, partial [Spirochaetales bacterium]|nr:ATP-binding protein [Spirochaetales bacterium]